MKEFFKTNRCPKYDVLARLNINFNELANIVFSPVHSEGNGNDWEIGEPFLSTNVLVDKPKSKLAGLKRAPASWSIMRSKIQGIMQKRFSFVLRKVKPASTNAEQIRKVECDQEEYFSQVNLKTKDQYP